MIEMNILKLAFVFLTIFVTGGGIRPASAASVEAISVIEKSAAREIDSPTAAESGNPAWRRRTWALDVGNETAVGETIKFRFV